MFVEEIMSAPAICCLMSDALDVPARLMWEHDYGAIAVVDDEGRLRGMLTDRDICMACYLRGKPPNDIAVQDTMAHNVTACRPEDAVESLEQKLASQQIRRVPVIDSADRPIGMVSLNGIALHAAALGDHDPLEHQVVRTMAAICEPRSRAQETHLGAKPPSKRLFGQRATPAS